MSNFKDLFNYSAKQNKILDEQLKKIEDLQNNYSGIELDKFKDETEKFKKRLASGETIEDIKLEAFACISECFKKIIQQKYPDSKGYYEEQIKASLILANGDLAQMLTGEGKTYALTLATYLEALKGEGVHVVTSNEYLAKRDLDDNKTLYDTLGLTSAFISDLEKDDIKRELYKSDIVYTTPNTIAFDFLRDTKVMSNDEKVMNGMASVILDEVDSSLIDDANTPYILSDSDSMDTKIYKDIDEIVKNLKIVTFDEQIEVRFKGPYIDEIDNKHIQTELFVSKSDKDFILTELGTETVRKKLLEKGYTNRKIKHDKEYLNYEPDAYLSHYINNALKANYAMQIDEDYLVTNGKIEVINKKGGRVAKGSKFSGGVHQALEAKEKITITNESVVSGSINQPNLFKLYKNFAGLSGTLTPSEKEFKQLYNKNIVVLKPRKGMNRIDENTEVFETKKEKENYIIKELQKCILEKRPVLLSTESVLESNYISDLLKKNNIEHKLLNAKNPHEEADIIKDAGQLGSITVTTNIAGRGTDIKPSKEALAAGGLYVLSTSLSESKRIDDQLRGRSGRQGNIGKSKFVVSLEDNIFKMNLSPKRFLETLKLVKDKQIDKLQKFVNEFQIQRETNSFATRKVSNDFQSVDALIRENYDKEIDTIRTTTNIKDILINMSIRKNKNILNANFTEQDEQKIKQEMLTICNDYWIDFINEAPIRKEQAISNSTYLSTKPEDEYLKLSFDRWKIYSQKINEEINTKIINQIKIPQKNITEELDNNIKMSCNDVTRGDLVENMINSYNNVKTNLTLQKQAIIEAIIVIQKERYAKFQIEVLDYITSEAALDLYIEKLNFQVIDKKYKDILNDKIKTTRNVIQNPPAISRKK